MRLNGLITFGICLTMVSYMLGSLENFEWCLPQVQDSKVLHLMICCLDLNNSLIGVLLRFRKDVVALSCDIKQMFYNFHVADGFRDY